MIKAVLNPISMCLSGLILGIVSRLLDVYTQNLGNMFSQMAIWILLGVLISIYSETKKKAALNVLLFCLGMLLSYYLAAILTDGVYGSSFIIGWTAFALCSPVLAYFAWMTKEQGAFPRLIGVAIVLVSLLSSIVLFGRLRVYDIIINAALVYFLFFKRVDR